MARRVLGIDDRPAGGPRERRRDAIGLVAEDDEDRIEPGLRRRSEPPARRASLRRPRAAACCGPSALEAPAASTTAATGPDGLADIGPILNQAPSPPA